MNRNYTNFRHINTQLKQQIRNRQNRKLNQILLKIRHPLICQLNLPKTIPLNKFNPWIIFLCSYTLSVIKYRMYKFCFWIDKFIHNVKIIDWLLDYTIVHHVDWGVFFLGLGLGLGLGLYFGVGLFGLVWELEIILHCVESDVDVL